MTFIRLLDYLFPRSTTLRIRNVQASDAATYQCQVVINVGEFVGKEVRLQIKLPPTIDDDQDDK